ncbi:hypothetical protein ACFQ1S_41705 [Kibdelosporangium lantanae]|uniref:Uncharacterized protein n=1 Tax=Kibdelosporangium lantanae TaxID=1497396 RepID=A0ABW3MMB5_9PSEU
MHDGDRTGVRLYKSILVFRLLADEHVAGHVPATCVPYPLRSVSVPSSVVFVPHVARPPKVW